MKQRTRGPAAVPLTRPDRFLSWRELTGRIPLHRATIYRLIRAGTFPPPVLISPGRSAFRESEIERYEANCRPGITARAIALNVRKDDAR